MSDTNSAATTAAMLSCLGLTAFGGWSWANHIWPAMVRGGVDYTGRVLISVFVSGEYAVAVGAAGACAGGLLAMTAYCCYNACQSEAPAREAQNTRVVVAPASRLKAPRSMQASTRTDNAEPTQTVASQV